jgi:hypothetical protein
VETALTDLFRYISGMDALAWATARAAVPPGEPFADAEFVLSETSSELMLQLLSTMPSETRFLALRQTLFRAMKKLAPLAYSKTGNEIFKNDLTGADRTVPFLKPHSCVEGHHGSALGVQLFGHGRMHPLYHQDPNMKVLSRALQYLSEDQALNVYIVVKEVTQHRCDFMSKRRGFIQGVPNGLPILNGFGETIAIILEEITRVSRDRRSTMLHYARVYIFKMTQMVALLLDEMHDSGSGDFETTRTAVKVGSACHRFPPFFYHEQQRMFLFGNFRSSLLAPRMQSHSRTMITRSLQKTVTPPWSKSVKNSGTGCQRRCHLPTPSLRPLTETASSSRKRGGTAHMVEPHSTPRTVPKVMKRPAADASGIVTRQQERRRKLDMV